MSAQWMKYELAWDLFGTFGDHEGEEQFNAFIDLNKKIKREEDPDKKAIYQGMMALMEMNNDFFGLIEMNEEDGNHWIMEDFMTEINR